MFNLKSEGSWEWPGIECQGSRHVTVGPGARLEATPAAQLLPAVPRWHQYPRGYLYGSAY